VSVIPVVSLSPSSKSLIIVRARSHRCLFLDMPIPFNMPSRCPSARVERLDSFYRDINQFSTDHSDLRRQFEFEMRTLHLSGIGYQLRSCRSQPADLSDKIILMEPSDKM
jgi:hypothetical protein